MRKEVYIHLTTKLLQQEFARFRTSLLTCLTFNQSSARPMASDAFWTESFGFQSCQSGQSPIKDQTKCYLKIILSLRNFPTHGKFIRIQTWMAIKKLNAYSPSTGLTCMKHHIQGNDHLVASCMHEAAHKFLTWVTWHSTSQNKRQTK